MKIFTILLMLSPLTCFAHKLYNGSFSIVYDNNSNSQSYFSSSYNTIRSNLSEACKKSAQSEALNYSFQIIDFAANITSIKVRCIDEDFNVETIDLTKEILNKVKK